MPAISKSLACQIRTNENASLRGNQIRAPGSKVNEVQRIGEPESELHKHLRYVPAFILNGSGTRCSIPDER